MKIIPIKNINQTNRNITFSSGKVHVFADFDETFLPEKHKDFSQSNDYRMINFLRKYFTDFKDFLKRTREDLKFTITTGRTYAEFETMAEISRDKNFGMPMPDTLICKNGSDEYLRTGTDAEFYKGGFFPFDYKRPNLEKEAELKKLTGWDGKLIKSKLQELLREHDFKIVEAGSEHEIDDYGWRSMFTHENLDRNNPNEWKVAFRNDGNCKIFFTLPSDMYSNPERHEVAVDVLKRLHEFLNENKINVHLFVTKEQNQCGGRYCYSIEPKVDENLWKHVSGEFNKGLTKLFDTKLAVERAKRNNDLVVIAGDSVNDRVMLNPVNYMLDELRKRKIDTSEINGNVPQTLIDFLEKHPSLYKIYKKIPFVCVIEKHINDGRNVINNNLEDIAKCFSKGKYQKIIIAENGKLEEGIKEAIRLYTKQNPAYAKKLAPSIEKEILQETN